MSNTNPQFESPNPGCRGCARTALVSLLTLVAVLAVGITAVGWLA